MLLERLRMVVKRNGRRLARLTASSPSKADPLDRIRRDPSVLFTDCGYQPDEWQRAALESDAPRQLWLCARQCGKTATASRVALREALLNPGSTVLIVSPSLRQSAEVLRRVVETFNAIGRPIPVVAESVLRIEFAGGRRIISLPNGDATIRGYSASTIVCDEASRLSESTMAAIRPALAAAPRSKLLMLSTPWTRSGPFYDAWHSSEPWERVTVRADQCDRISQEHLAAERAALSDPVYRCEYECAWLEMDSPFDMDAVRECFNPDLQPVQAGVR